MTQPGRGRVDSPARRAPTSAGRGSAGRTRVAA